MYLDIHYSCIIIILRCLYTNFKNLTNKCLRKEKEKFKYLINRNFSQLTIHQTESDGFPGAIVTKAPVSLSPRRGVDFHWRGCSLVQHDFNTVYSGPDWKGTPRCLPSSTESAPRWSRNATPSLHPATRKKKGGREEGKETPVEPLEMSGPEMPAPGWLISRQQSSYSWSCYMWINFN